MKMKKIGLLALSLVLALAITGAGFATWTDTVDIDGHIGTGTVKIGVRDTGTSDPGTTPDPRREVDFGGAPVAADKHVATTTSTDGNYKCWHAGADWYDSVTYRYENVYPGYAPTTYTEISNCGSIPVKFTGSGVVVTAVSSGAAWTIPDCMDIVYWQVDDKGVYQGSGDDATSLGTFLYLYQLDPCHWITITLVVHFYTNDLPQGEWIEWTITAEGTQWNDV